MMTGTTAIVRVPYRGAAPALTDLLWGTARRVMWMSCLEIMRDARNIQNTDLLESDNGPVSVRHDWGNGRPVRARRRHPI
jgi:hypothetical protein